jgi:hypothetical protein
MAEHVRGGTAAGGGARGARGRGGRLGGGGAATVGRVAAAGRGDGRLRGARGVVPQEVGVRREVCQLEVAEQRAPGVRVRG